MFYCTGPCRKNLFRKSDQFNTLKNALSFQVIDESAVLFKKYSMQMAPLHNGPETIGRTTLDARNPY